MKVQAFITSGILEKYVLNMTTEQEVQEVLDMASQHLEIKEELAAIRQSLQGYILAHQVMPPANLKENSLSVTKSKRTNDIRSEPARPNRSYRKSAEKKPSSPSGTNYMGIASALLALALIAASFSAYSFYKDVERAGEEVEAAKAETASVEKQLASEEQRVKDLNTQLSFYHDRNNQLMTLAGSRRAPGARATVYWNKETTSAVIDVVKMPDLVSGRVAVIWVNTGRQTQKIGVLKPNNPGETTPLTFVANPDLFYVTEEISSDVERPNRSRILMTGSL
ncbi:MAG: anti-sigma factor [Bacteroidota bacterium]